MQPLPRTREVLVHQAHDAAPLGAPLAENCGLRPAVHEHLDECAVDLCGHVKHEHAAGRSRHAGAAGGGGRAHASSLKGRTAMAIKRNGHMSRPYVDSPSKGLGHCGAVGQERKEGRKGEQTLGNRIEEKQHAARIQGREGSGSDGRVTDRVTASCVLFESALTT